MLNVKLFRFQHGTTSGRRVILVDGKEVRNTGWQFKLVGKESFLIGKHRACIIIEANGLKYVSIFSSHLSINDGREIYLEYHLDYRFINFITFLKVFVRLQFLSV